MKAIYNIALAMLTSGALLAFAAGDAVAQQKPPTLKQQIIGWWMVVSVTNEQGGTKTEPFGPNPQGYFVYDRSGHYSSQVVRPGRPKFASNNRNTGTPEENKATVQGTITTFGTYTVHEKEHSITQHIIGSSFPNWDGTDQKRLVTITGDEMKFTNPTASIGGSALVVLKRVK